MRSHVKLLNTLSVQKIPQNQVFGSSDFALGQADADYITFEDAVILMQSFSYYLAHIEFYEYRINAHSTIDIEITSDSFFMIAMQEGCCILYDEDNQVVSEVLSKSCKLTYVKAGKYKRSMIGKNHQILLINIKPDWFINKYGELKELRELIENYRQGTQIFSLPSFNIGPQLFNVFFKLNVGSNRRDIDVDIHLFLNECMTRYLVKLHNQVNYSESQEQKSREIAAFVTENFASKIVGD